MKYKVLVFPCGSEIGLEMHNAMKWSTHVELYGGSSVKDHGRYVYKNHIDNIPFVTDEKFIDAVNKIVEEKRIDCIYPAHDDVVLEAAKAYEAGKLS